MTPESKDIIELVKELQSEHQNDLYLHCTPSFASDMPRINIAGPYCVHMEHLHNSFPAIAQALLIAVEALENLEAMKNSITCTTQWRHEVVSQALSRIRSLTTQ